MASFDDIKDKGLLSSRGMELLKTRQQRIQTKSVQEVRDLEKISQNTAEIDRLIKSTEGAFEDRLARIKQLSDNVDRAKQELARLESGRAHGTQKQFVSSMRSAMSQSATMEDIRSVQRVPSTFSSAIDIAKGMSASEIQYEQERMRRQALQQSARITEAAQLPGSERKIESLLRERERLVGQAGLYSAASTAQRRLGLDPESRYYDAYEKTQRVQREQAALGMRGEVRGGMSRGEEQLSQAMQKLIQTFEKLNAVTDKTSTEAGQLADEFNKAEQEVAKQKIILSEAGKGGGGGGGMFSLMGNLGTLGMAGAQAGRYIGVTSELSQMQNRTGFANVQNSRFNDIVAAGRGDMAALRRVLSNQAGSEAGYGNKLGDREGKAQLVETLGQFGRTGGALEDSVTSVKGVASGAWRGIKGFFGGAAAGSAAGPAGTVGGAAAGIGGGVLAGALADASPELVRSAQMGTDYMKGITQGQTRLQAQAQYKQLQDALSYISDTSSQSARDYGYGVGMATRGLGFGRDVGNLGREVTYRGSGMLGGADSAREMSGLGFGGSIGQVGGSGGDIKDFIKRHEGFRGSAYDDVGGRGTIGFGHLIKPGEQFGTLTKQQGASLFDRDFDSIKSQVNNMLGPDVMSGLSPTQLGGLYSMAFNAGPGALNYGRKGQSVLSRLKQGDITGASNKLATTAITVDGQYNEAIAGRRLQEARMLGGTDATGEGAGGLETKMQEGGGRRERVLRELTDPNYRKTLGAQAGLSNEEITRLTSMGVGMLGAQFRGGADILRGGELARSGYLQSPEQYMQARGALAGVGGNERDLEAIMKNAVANGMDASKHIMEMVQGISAISQRSAEAGISTVSGATQVAGRAFDALTAAGATPDIAIKAGLAATNKANELAGGTGLDIFNVMEAAQLQKGFPGAKPWEQERLRKMTPEQLAELRNTFQGGDPSKIRQKQVEMGVLGTINSLEDLTKVENATNTQTRGALLGGIGMDSRLGAILKKSPSELTDEEKSFINARGYNSGVSGVGVFGATGTGAAGQGALETKLGGATLSVEEQKSASGLTDAKLFADGAAKIATAAGSFDALGTVMKDVANKLDAMALSEATRKAATEQGFGTGAFSTEVVPFRTAVDEFKLAVDRLVKAVGSSSGAANPLNNLRP